MRDGGRMTIEKEEGLRVWVFGNTIDRDMGSPRLLNNFGLKCKTT